MLVFRVKKPGFCKKTGLLLFQRQFVVLQFFICRSVCHDRYHAHDCCRAHAGVENKFDPPRSKTDNYIGMGTIYAEYSAVLLNSRGDNLLFGSQRKTL